MEQQKPRTSQRLRLVTRPALALLTALALLYAAPLAAQSAANNASASGATLFDLDFWARGQNRLTLHSYLTGGKGTGTISSLNAISMLQWGGNTRLAGKNELASAFYMDLHGGDWLGRSGLRLAERTRSRTSDLAFSYTRGGGLFASPEDTGIAKGLEIMEAKGAFTPRKGLNFSSSLKQTTTLPDAGGANGGVTRNLNGGLAYAFPEGLGKIEAGRDITRTLAPDGSSVTRTLDTVRVEGKLAPGAQATVQYDAQATTALAPNDAPSGNYAQKTRVGLRLSPFEQLQLTGSFQNALGTNGGQDAANLKLEATPFAQWRNLRVTAGWEDKYRDDSTLRSREGRIELPTLPFGKLRLSGGFKQTSGPDAERLVGLMDAEFAPVPFLEIAGGTRMRNGVLPNNLPDPDYPDGYNVRVALKPIRRVRLTGSLSRNPDRDDGTLKRLQSQALGLETDFGFASFRGQAGTDNEYLANRLARTLEMNLALRLSRADTLTTGYEGRYLDAAGLSGSATYLLSYSRRVGSLFDLTLSGKIIRNEGDSVSPADRIEYKAEAKVGIHF